MEKTVNIDFDNSSSVILGYSADILNSTVDFVAWKHHTHGTVLGYNLSATSASNGLTLSVAPPSAALNAVFAGDNISLSTEGVSTTVSVFGLQSSGPYLTTAAATDHDHGGIANATGMIGGTIAGSAWSLSIPDFLVTAAQSDHTHSEFIPLPNSTQYATSYLAETFLTTAARVTHIHGVASGTNITIGSSSNGLALSVAPALGTNTSLVGASVSMTANTSGITLSFPNYATAGNNISLSGNTLGTMTLINSGTVTMAGGNNITLSQSGNAFTILGPNVFGTNTSADGVLMTANSSGITLSMPSVTNTAANAVYAGDYISLSTDGAATTVSVTNLQATSNTSLITSNAMNTSERGRYFYTSNNTFANSTHSHGGFSLATTNIAASVSSASNGLTLSLSVNTVGGIAVGDGATNIVGGTALFSDVNGISFGIAGSTVTASHNAYSASSQLTNTFLTTGYTSHTHSNLYPPLSGTTYYLSSHLSTIFAKTNHLHGSLATTNIVGSSNSAGISLSVPMGTLYFLNDSNVNLTWHSSSASLITSIWASAAAGTGTVGGGGGGIAARITGNTLGTTTLVSSGTLTLGGSNGITLSQSGNRINVIGEQGSVYFTGGSNVTWSYSISGIHTSIMLTAGGGGGTGGGGMGTGVSTSGAITASGNTNGISMTVPPIGYLFFSNIVGFSFTSAVAGVSTTVGLSTN